MGGALYFPPDDSGEPVALSTGHTVPASAWAMYCASAYAVGLEVHDVDDPGGVVFRNPTGGGSSVTYWRTETASSVHKWRKVQAAGGGAGTGVNAGDWEWVTPAAYLTHLFGATSHADLPGAYGLSGLSWAAPATAGEAGHLTGTGAAGASTNLDAEVRIPIPSGYNPSDHTLTVVVSCSATPAPAVARTIDLAKVTVDDGTSDLCTTAAQTITGSRASYTFNITDTGFAATGVLNVALRMTLNDTGGGGGSVGYVYGVWARIT